VKDKNPYCFQCGRHGQKEGVCLRVERYTATGGRTIENHYITCEACQQRWYVVNFGVWGPSIDLEKAENYEGNELD